MTEIHNDPTQGMGADIKAAEGRLRHQVRGFNITTAMELFGTLCAWKFACSVKHLGGWYFVEVPIGLHGDPCYQQQARVMDLAANAGCKTLQTGQTLRIIG